MNTTTVVLMIIFVFTFVPLALAEIARAKFRYTIEDFFLQSRRMNLLMAFFTVYATWVSSFAFLGSTASFYNQGPLYMTCFAWNILFALLFMVMGRRIWFYGKRHGYITATDFFDDIYRSKWLSFTITAIITLFTIPYLMIQLYSGAFIIETASGGQIPWKVAGLLFYLVIIIYLWAGGLRAVAMSDVYYGILTVLSMIVTGIILISDTGAGIEGTFRSVQENNPDFFILGSTDSNSVLMWLAMFIVIPLGAFMGPPMWIRMYAISNEKIFKALPLLLTIITIMYIGPMLAGNAAKYIYPNGTFSDNLLIVMIMEKLPIIMTAVILCGIAAASLSTANSQIHAISAVYTIDIHKRYIRPKSKERELLKVARWAVLVISIVAYLLMIVFRVNIIQMGTVSMSGTMQIFVPAVGALIWKKSSSKAAVLGIWLGVLMVVVGFFVFSLPVVYAAVVGFAVNAAVFVIGSMTLKTRRGTANRIEKYRKAYEEERLWQK